MHQCGAGLHRRGAIDRGLSLTRCHLSKTDTLCRQRAAIRGAEQRAGENGGNQMPLVTIVYWRDIPAQVIVGKGRGASKMPLAERFEQAIDRCAMKIGAKGGDAYMAEWRKADAVEVAGDADQVAKSEAARLETEYDSVRIKALIDADGWNR